jgi:hypothetical protein
MEQDSQIEILDSQLRELYGRVTWSHKTHEKCADILLKRHQCLKVSQIILSALTTTGILIAVFGENKIAGILSAIFSTILFGLNTYTKDYDLGEIAQKHANAAAELWDIRETYLSLLVDIRAGRLTLEELIVKRDQLQENLFQTYKGVPRTINAAYNAATKGLKKNEELTFSVAELNSLLPEALRTR